MFIRPTLALVLAILWLWPAGLHAQSEALQEALRQGQALYEAGQLEQAIPLWRKALELREKEFGPNHPTTADVLDILAITYRDLGRYTEAEPLQKRSLAIREKALGPDHPDFATRLNLLAAIYHAQGRYAEALPLSNAFGQVRRRPGVGEFDRLVDVDLVHLAVQQVQVLARARTSHGTTWSHVSTALKTPMKSRLSKAGRYG